MSNGPRGIAARLNLCDAGHTRIIPERGQWRDGPLPKVHPVFADMLNGSKQFKGLSHETPLGSTSPNEPLHEEGAVDRLIREMQG